MEKPTKQLYASQEVIDTLSALMIEAENLKETNPILEKHIDKAHAVLTFVLPIKE